MMYPASENMLQCDKEVLEMRKNWFTKALVAIMTLALVAGALTVAPKAALAQEVTLVLTPSPATVKEGETFTVTAAVDGGTFDNDTCEWTYTGATFVSKTGTHGEFATFTAGTEGTAVITATLAAGSDNNGTGTTNVTINKQPSTDLWGVKISANAASVYVGDQIKFSSTITGVVPSKKTYEWTITGATNMTNVSQLSGNEVTGKAATPGTVTATLAVTDGDGKTVTSDTVSVDIALRPATLTFKETSAKAYPGSSISYATLLGKLSATKGSDQKVVFSDGFTSVYEGGNYSVPSTATAGEQITFTAAVPAGASYDAATSTNSFVVTVVKDAVVTLSSDKVVLNNAGVQQQVIAYSNIDAGGLKLGDYKNTVASVTLTPDGNTKATLTITAKATGTVTIPVTNEYGDSTAYLKVIVGTPTPEIDAHYAGGLTTLSKKEGQKSVDLHIHVDDPLVNYVTIVRSNIRTFVKGYYTHPSTYKYVAALDSNGDAIVTIYPQYNGTCQYTVYAGDSVSSNPHITAYAEGSNVKKLTVNGYTTLPQTGPDYTWAYVLSGLCVATLATAVALNIKRKKSEQGI